MSKMVWVETTAQGLPIRIFRSRLATAGYHRTYVLKMDRAQAVADIRHQLFIRSEGFCELCISPINEKTAHMHEQIHRGQGGEISLANSVMICPTCHNWQHRDRNPRFGKKT